MPYYKQTKKGWHVFLVMGDVVIFDQPPVSEVRVSGQPSPAHWRFRAGPPPARPAPPRPHCCGCGPYSIFVFSHIFRHRLHF